MADRRPLGEKEYNPLDDTKDLISSVVTGRGNQFSANQPVKLKEKEELPKVSQKVIELKNPSQDSPQHIKEQPQEISSQKEDTVIFKFSVPRADFVAAKKIVAVLEGELNARVDLSNLGRGWITRLITAEKEIMEAAKHQQKLKTPNSRDRLQIAEVDHALAVIQSVAFRRAEPVK